MSINTQTYFSGSQHETTIKDYLSFKHRPRGARTGKAMLVETEMPLSDLILLKRQNTTSLRERREIPFESRF